MGLTGLGMFLNRQMAGEAKTEAYRQIQPFSQIPVLEVSKGQ